MDKEKEFRGARYVRGTLTLSRFFFEFFLFRGGGQKEVCHIEIFALISKGSLSLSLILLHLFLSLAYKQTKKMGF